MHAHPDELQTLNIGPNPFRADGKCSDPKAANFDPTQLATGTGYCLYQTVRTTSSKYVSMYVFSLSRIHVCARAWCGCARGCVLLTMHPMFRTRSHT